MTITLASIADVPAALRGGGVGVCLRCKGRRDVPCAVEGDSGMTICPACNGTGTVRYHWVGGYGKRKAWRKSSLDYPVKFANDDDTVRYFSEWLKSDRIHHTTRLAIATALAAIGPNDVLIHDGTDLGARCAEVVAAIARQRKEPTNA